MMTSRMKRYEVTIVRTITTAIEVMAVDSQAASDQIHNYGIVEAANDYDRLNEVMLSKITKAVRKGS